MALDKGEQFFTFFCSFAGDAWRDLINLSVWRISLEAE
jgi:hypothetical protein